MLTGMDADYAFYVNSEMSDIEAHPAMLYSNQALG